MRVFKLRFTTALLDLLNGDIEFKHSAGEKRRKEASSADSEVQSTLARVRQLNLVERVEHLNVTIVAEDIEGFDTRRRKNNCHVLKLYRRVQRRV
jgi:hypothetical protein